MTPRGPYKSAVAGMSPAQAAAEARLAEAQKSLLQVREYIALRYPDPPAESHSPDCPWCARDGRKPRKLEQQWVCEHCGYRGSGEDFENAEPKLVEKGTVDVRADGKLISSAPSLMSRPLAHDAACRMRRGGKCDCGAAGHNKALKEKTP
jgi:hypothetical protein